MTSFYWQRVRAAKKFLENSTKYPEGKEREQYLHRENGVYYEKVYNCKNYDVLYDAVSAGSVRNGEKCPC